jgi:cytochrome c peroxidase
VSIAEAAEPYLQAPPGGLSPLLPVPPGNPLTRQRIDLGEALFFETALSRDGSLSCASCHDPALAFTDGRARAVGIEAREGQRNAPTLLNAAYREFLFWDGRAESLEAQALRPMENASELGNSHEEVVRRLRRNRSYREQFARAFGTDEITIDRVAQAIASFERTLLSGDSDYDRYRAGEPSALTPSQRRGLALFAGRARCTFCHTGELFTDQRFHNTGISWKSAEVSATETIDLGRFDVTARAVDRAAFKTPSLRDVERTAPYMHDGSLATLEAVVEFYNEGGHPNAHLDAFVLPLDLSAGEQADLVAFLRALTGRDSAAD